MPGLLDNFREILQRGMNPNLPPIGGRPSTTTFVNPQLVGAGRDMEMALPASTQNNYYSPNPPPRPLPSRPAIEAPVIPVSEDITPRGLIPVPEPVTDPAARGGIPAPEFANPYTGRDREPSMAGLDIPGPSVDPYAEEAPADAPVLAAERERVVPGEPITGDLPTIGKKSNRELAEEAMRAAGMPVTDQDKGFKKKLGAFLKEALRGIGETAKMNPNADLRGILIGGAIGGVGRYGLNPKINEERERAKKLAEATERYKIEAGISDRELKEEQVRGGIAKTQKQLEQADARIQQGDARIKQGDERLQQAQQTIVNRQYRDAFDRALKRIKLGYKKGEDPNFDAEAARVGLDIEQWDANTKTAWVGQNLMTFDENGKMVPQVDASGEPVVDVTRRPVEIDIEGQKFTVPETRAASILGGIAAQNAQREQAVTTKQADLDLGVEKANRAEEEKAASKVLEGQALQNEAAGYEKQARETTDPDEAAKLQAKAHATRSKGNALVTEGNEMRTRTRQQAPKLKPVIVKAGKHSEADFIKRAQAKGITGETLKRAVARARQDGVIQ
jgi:gas vesicle protein